MTNPTHVSSDEIRTRFAAAMSEMYRQEVPLYGDLIDLVTRTNQDVLTGDPGLRARFEQDGGLARLSAERHGAIRLGLPAELATMRRLFAVMGMHPVGYYDLAPAGVPVHATAFRPVTDEALRRNPFRVFTSLLRLELVEDTTLRQQAEDILSTRRIFTQEVLDLINRAEDQGGLDTTQADRFVAAAIETFRWHGQSTVTQADYRHMLDAHRLVADVVCFPGPHINHLTPRTLDIDATHRAMAAAGMRVKASIEGPPYRRCPILLRQTSFLALNEAVLFPAGAGQESQSGAHTARFGEIEQRGVALTPTGRALYDRLLDLARADAAGGSDHATSLTHHFAHFPDDEETLRTERLGWFRYAVTPGYRPHRDDSEASMDDLVRRKVVTAIPITYEDFLPVSAAGIFQSNLGTDAARSYSTRSHRKVFESALGAQTRDEQALYEAAQARSVVQVRAALSRG